MQKIIAWVDVEANGISPEVCSLLEVAVALTDFNGEFLAEPYSALVAIHDISRVMAESQDGAKEIHEQSGLWNDLWTSTGKPTDLIDSELASLLKQSANDKTILFGGNSPSLDRRFAELYLPTFYRKMSHRSVDVTTLSLVLQESNTAPMFRKEGKHRALPDVLDSIEEYRHYLSFVKE